MNSEDLMRIAIEQARIGIAAGQSPFGCAIAQNGALIAATHNTVLLDTDITAHAEINALRSGCHACRNIFLIGAVVATTCEPCPMCMAALHWARVHTVYYGATIADAMRAGFNELNLPAGQLLDSGNSKVKLVQSPLRDDCAVLFEEWLAQTDRIAY